MKSWTQSLGGSSLPYVPGTDFTGRRSRFIRQRPHEAIISAAAAIKLARLQVYKDLNLQKDDRTVSPHGQPLSGPICKR